MTTARSGAESDAVGTDDKGGKGHTAGPHAKRRPRGRRVTGRDVAKRAGVSQSTVSFVINNDPNQTIPDATRERVLAAAAELGYVPQAAARSLRRGRSDLVVLLLPDWPMGGILPRIIESLQQELAGRGLQLLLHHASSGLDVADLWREVRAGAVIRMGSLGAERDAALRHAPVDHLVETVQSEAEPGWVLVPGRLGGRLQAEHLLARGHRRLGFGWPDDSRLKLLARDRLIGVQEVCAEAGLPEPRVEDVSFDPDELASAVDAWRGAGVTGIASFNDELALAVMAIARRRGLHVPHDLAIVGMDDAREARLADPPLTSVALDAEAVGRHLGQALFGEMAGTPTARAAEDVLRLVPRSSS